MNSFQDLSDQFFQSSLALQKNLPLVLTIIGGLYAIQLVNVILGYRLNLLGIQPRRVFGLIGIPVSPFLHGNFNHLFFNSLPLAALMSFVLLGGLPIFYTVSAIIIILGGLGTWLIGRPGLHVGASGVIMGYWSFLLLQAYQNPTAISLALGLVCIYYFGGLLFNLFPMEVKSSWEAHVSGFAAGLVAYFVYPDFLNWVPDSLLA